MPASLEIQKQLDALPHYRSVPKEFHANLAYRRRLIAEGSASRENAKQIWIACARDPLFFINSFVWCYEPRKVPATLPFITWDCQDPALIEINNAINSHDLAQLKSRDMGLSWLNLLVMEWRWQFKEMQAFLLLSRKEDLVDRSGDSDALMWKLDYVIDNQPKWLLPNYDKQNDRKRLMLINTDNGSTIAGDSTTGDAGRGGRKTAILLDEFASVENGAEVLAATADVTKCRLFVSTPKGAGNNAFYKICQRDGMKVLRLHWSQHPDKSVGLYTDPETKKLRSPWFDEECRRRNPQEIAQELEMDFLGSAYQTFEAAMLDRIQSTVVCNPVFIGDMEFDPDSLEVRGFRERKDGPLRLWFQPDEKNRAPAGEYVAGADISMGTGASCSALAAANRNTKEKVLELATGAMQPKEFAKYAVAICRWLKNADGRAALLGWEANGGCGQNFGRGVIEFGHHHVYYRTNEKGASKKVSEDMGWWSTPSNKNALLIEYHYGLKNDLYINRSYYAIEECRSYINLPNGNSEHSSAAGGDGSDPSGVRDNHGDRVIADAICWHLMKSVKTAPVEEQPIPQFCLANRREARERARQEESLY